MLRLMVVILKVVLEGETHARMTTMAEIQDDRALDEMIKERGNGLDLVYIVIYIHGVAVLI